MEEDEGGMRNCTFRYSWEDPQTTFALWIDGPCTFIAAVMALVGAHFAVRFLRKAGLNKHLTAALFALCVIDSLLMLTVFFFYSIEASGLLLLRSNIMYDRQTFTSSLHGVAQSMTTASTLLVIWVTLQRFMVVLRPLRYARNPAAGRSTLRRVSHASRRENAENEKVSGEAAVFSSSPEGNGAATTLIRSRYRAPSVPLRKMLRSFIIPGLVILVSFIVNVPVYFEFTVQPCYDWQHETVTSCPVPTRFREAFTRYKAILMSLTQTIGPVAAIAIMTALTEYRINQSLRQRRKLFENRSQSVVMTDQLREKVSRTVAVFITVKFLIFRTMPVFFDIYENLYGIESFGAVLTVLVRISDFMIVLNSATNSLAYFGRKTWLENRLRTHLLKKEERKLRKNSIRGDSMLGSDRRRLSSNGRRSSEQEVPRSPRPYLVTQT